MIKRDIWLMAAGQLGQAGKPAARFEAELLLRSALGENRAHFFASLADEVEPGGLKQFWQWLEERLEGVPLQHLVGKQEFMGLDFKVTPAVLIPRPETETAVERALELLAGIKAQRPPDEVVSVADIATGSGAIAVALAHRMPKLEVWATDISAEALAVARENASWHGVGERIVFREGSWGEALQREGRFFDCIVSNPPYVVADEIERLAVEVQREPRLALDGGRDGLECYRQLIPQSAALLRRGGYLVLEVGQGQAGPVGALLWRSGFGGIAAHKDLAGIERVVVGRR